MHKMNINVLWGVSRNEDNEKGEKFVVFKERDIFVVT